MQTHDAARTITSPGAARLLSCDLHRLVLGQFGRDPASRPCGRPEGGVMAGFVDLAALFDGRDFDRAIIVLCVRWHRRAKPSLPEPLEGMAERGRSTAPPQIMRRMRRDAPAFGRRWNPLAQPAGPSRRVDRTYVKARGGWVDLDGRLIEPRTPSTFVSAQSVRLLRPRHSFARRSRVRDRPVGSSPWMATPHRTAAGANGRPTANGLPTPGGDHRSA